MALSQNVYVGDGSTVNRALSFSYISTADVFVLVDGVDFPTFTWVNASTVSISPAPATDAVITIYRDTPRTNIVATLANGQVDTALSYNQIAKQMLYSVQELEDQYGTIVSATTNAALTAADLVLTNADVVLTHADVVLTAADVVTIAGSEAATTSDAAATAIDASATAADVLLTAADVVLTGVDVVTTHADVVLTNADVVLTGVDVGLTGADVTSTNADAVSTAADAASTALDVIATAADVVLTGVDVGLTGADVTSTNADAVSTAADAAATALDASATAADVLLTAADVITVAADKATVAADKGTVAADKATVAADMATTLGYKNAADADVTATNADAASTAADVLLTAADVVSTGNDVTATNADAVSTAADAAAAALTVANLQGTSTTSLAIAVASKGFTTQAAKSFGVGVWLLATSDADPTNYMHGQVTAYTGTALTLNVTNIGGTGTFADWTISVAGTQGSIGATGPQGDPGADGAGTGDVVGPASAVDSNFAGFDTTTGKLVKDSGSAAADFAVAAHNHSGVYQPLDAVLTATTASFLTTDESKLDAIEALADVTDATNVTAAGALMDSEVTNLAQVKAFDSSAYAPAAILTDPAITGTINEDVYTITDGAAFAIDPGNGSIQQITLGANRTPTVSGWTAGDSVTLYIADGTAYTITWTTIGVVWKDATAPTLATTGFTEVSITYQGGVYRGVVIGDFAS